MRRQRALPAFATPVPDPVPVTRYIRTGTLKVRQMPTGDLVFFDYGGNARKIPLSLARVRGYYETARGGR